MNNSSEKLERLRLEVEADSASEAEALLKNAKKAAEESLEEKKEKLRSAHESKFLRVTEDFRSAEKRRVSEVRFNEGRRVLLHRGKLIEEFFGGIEKELKDLTASPKYAGYLKRCAEKANEYSPLGDNVTVFCRPEDTEAVRKVISAYGASVEETDEIRLGGLMFRYGGERAFTDLTLDTALEKERRDFASVKELQTDAAE